MALLRRISAYNQNHSLTANTGRVDKRSGGYSRPRRFPPFFMRTQSQEKRTSTHVQNRYSYQSDAVRRTLARERKFNIPLVKHDGRYDP